MIVEAWSDFFRGEDEGFIESVKNYYLRVKLSPISEEKAPLGSCQIKDVFGKISKTIRDRDFANILRPEKTYLG